MNGFAAGTLVHTDKGLVPIQNIKVGDLVLSMTEDELGQYIYKPVTKTTKMTREIYRLLYWARDQYEEDTPKIHYVLTTLGNCIWSIDKEKWLKTDMYLIDENIGDELWVKDQQQPYHFLYINQVYQGYDENHKLYGYTIEPFARDWADSRGIETFLDIRDDTIQHYTEPYKNEYIPNIAEDIDMPTLIYIAHHADGTPLLVNTYHIEVEDFKTYFVGELGLWVHQ
jgi:transcription-repair coupling factor (superfamily II helicase)